MLVLCYSLYRFAFTKLWLYTRLECGQLSEPRYGGMDVKIGEDGFSEIATFNCAPGYYVSGSSALHCEKGVWDGREPECKREYYQSIFTLEYICTATIIMYNECMVEYVVQKFLVQYNSKWVFSKQNRACNCTNIQCLCSYWLWCTRGSTERHCWVWRHSLHAYCSLQVWRLPRSKRLRD